MKVQFEEAKKHLLAGKVVALPTETVYGLTGRVTSQCAIEQIFSLKKRSKANPLTIQCASADETTQFVSQVPDDFHLLTKAFWPGPLTLVLPSADSVPANIRGNLPSIGLRVPSHHTTLQILRDVGPLVAPSANLSGSPSATTRSHVEEDFGPHLPVLEAEEPVLGIESTLLIFTAGQWKIGRIGAISSELLEKVLGYLPPLLGEEEEHLSPSKTLKHNQPQTKLTTLAESHQIVLGFSDRNYPLAKKVLSLGKSDDPAGVSRHLYQNLRDLDKLGYEEIGVDLDLPKSGIWLAIIQRLESALYSD